METPPLSHALDDLPPADIDALRKIVGRRDRYMRTFGAAIAVVGLVIGVGVTRAVTNDGRTVAAPVQVIGRSDGAQSNSNQFDSPTPDQADKLAKIYNQTIDGSTINVFKSDTAKCDRVSVSRPEWAYTATFPSVVLKNDSVVVSTAEVIGTPESFPRLLIVVQTGTDVTSMSLRNSGGETILKPSNGIAAATVTPPKNGFGTLQAMDGNGHILAKSDLPVVSPQQCGS